MFLFQTYFVSILIVSTWYFFLKIGQKVLQIILLNCIRTFLIDKDTNPFSIIFQVIICNLNLFFWLNDTFQIHVSPSFLGLSCSSSFFHILSNMTNYYLRFNNETRHFMNRKILLKLTAIYCGRHDD